jgi:hypothetical protein
MFLLDAGRVRGEAGAGQVVLVRIRPTRMTVEREARIARAGLMML